MTIHSDIKSLLALLEQEEEREARRKAAAETAEVPRASNEELRLPPDFLRFRRSA